MAEDVRIDIARVQEKIGAVQAAVDKAHSRVDGLQKEVKEELKGISTDVKILVAHMNQEKGSKAAYATIGALVIALAGALAKIFIS